METYKGFKIGIATVYNPTIPSEVRRLPRFSPEDEAELKAIKPSIISDKKHSLGTLIRSAVSVMGEVLSAPVDGPLIGQRNKPQE